MGTDDTHGQELAARQQRASEYFLEHEGLTGDLPDTQARVLLAWASARAGTLAADAARSDAEVDALLGMIRRAVRSVAQTIATAATTDDSTTDLAQRAEQAFLHELLQQR